MRDWLVRHWRNGLRFQIAISVIILGGIVALYLQISTLIDDIHNADAPVLSISNVAVTDEPHMPGQPITFARLICNDSSAIVSGTVGYRLVKAEPPESEYTVPDAATVEAAPGCSGLELHAFTIPPTVPPGSYKLRLALQTTTPELSFYTATSEPFEIGGAVE